jgi:hypothetical protein
VSRLASTARLLAGCSIIIGAAALVAGAAAQGTKSIPDFSSNQTAWKGPNGVNFVAVPGSAPPITNDPRYPHISNGEANRRGVQPTYRISDITHANLKQWAKEVMKKDNDEVHNGKIAYTPGSYCRPAGVTAFALDGGPYYFIQKPDKVLIIQQGEQIARQVYLNVPHSASPKPTWFGESVGHYEGDTLVIDTIGLNANTFIDHYRTPHTEKLHVIERWRMIDGGKKLEVEFTIEDQDTFNEPWKAAVRFDRAQDTLEENICVEGNLVLFDWDLPEAKTPNF